MHTGSSKLSNFLLSNILCVPSMKQNLISVSQFYHSNNTSIEFYPSFFLVKDLTAGAPLIRGPSKNNVYEWPSTVETTSRVKQVFVTVKASLDNWHNHLSHPYSKILHYRANKCLFVSPSELVSKYVCELCPCNKSHNNYLGSILFLVVVF